MPLYPVCKVSEFPQGSCKLVTIGRMEIGVFYVEGGYYAYRNICPHAGAPVCRGKITGTTLASNVYEYAYGRDGCILRCPWHGWEFDLKTGAHLVDTGTRLKNFPVVVKPQDGANENLESFTVEIREDVVHLSLPN
jgi:nitrite reductase (NADH) small subunit